MTKENDMNEKKKRLLACVLWGLVALIWIGTCALTLRHGQMGFLPFLCAVLSTVSFIVQIRRYRNMREEE